MWTYPSFVFSMLLSMLLFWDRKNNNNKIWSFFSWHASWKLLIQPQQQLSNNNNNNNWGKKMSFLALDSSCSWQVSFFSDLIFFLTKNPNLFVNILYVCVYWICYWSYGLNKKKSSSSSFDDLMKWIWKTLAH